MRVVADSHAFVWYLMGSSQLSDAASRALADAEGSDDIVASIVATLIDLWYVSQTTRAVSPTDIAGLRDQMASSSAATWQPIDLAVVDATMAIPRTSSPTHATASSSPQLASWPSRW